MHHPIRRILGAWVLFALCASASLAQSDDAAQLASSPADYLVGIEDVLRVVVWGEKDLTMTVKVRPDGKITLPLVNDIAVVGMTPVQIRDRIAEGLGEFIRGANVTVIVEEVNSFRIYLLGEVATQGAIQLYQPTRLLQAVAMAGGVAEFSKREIVVLREEYGQLKRIEINYRRLLAGESTADNIYLKPGDTLLFK